MRLPFRRDPALAPLKQGQGRRARRLGRRGERAAARILRRRGYRILARNLRTPAGEVDLLAEEGGQTVLVEVKTAASGGCPPPSPEALSARFARRQRLRQRAVVRWLRRHADFRCAWFRHDLVLVAFDGRHFVVTIRRDVLAERDRRDR